MKLSIVIAVFNEVSNIASLLKSLKDALSDFTYEIILVDDGSSDGTAKEIQKYADEHVRLIIFTRNFGQTAALSAGINKAEGEYIVTMDGDLQHDPYDIPFMYKKMMQCGCDVVSGIRKKRKDNFFVRKLPSMIANFVIRRSTGVKIKDYGCTLRIFKKDAAKRLDLYGELHRFIPMVIVLNGDSIVEMEVNHLPRKKGKSKYGLNRTFKVISDLLLVIFLRKYLRRPIHLFGTLGVFTLFFGILIDVYFLVEKIRGMDIWGRPLLILGVILTISGIQLITAGIMSEILMRTYFESQNKKIYQIKEEFTGSQGESVFEMAH